jgi:DNA-directed RNA polymerase beta subunit
MEKDSLLSHGTTFLLQDRLLNCTARYLRMMPVRRSSSTHNAANFNPDYRTERKRGSQQAKITSVLSDPILH